MPKKFAGNGSHMERNASDIDSKRDMARQSGANGKGGKESKAGKGGKDGKGGKTKPSLRGSSGAKSTKSRSATRGKRSMRVEASMKMTIKNVNFTKLTEQTKERLSAEVKKSVSLAADVPESAVNVTLYAGSVKINATIACNQTVFETEDAPLLEEAMREQMKAALEADAVRQEILQHSLADDGILVAKTGELEVTRPEAETVVTDQGAMPYDEEGCAKALCRTEEEKPITSSAGSHHGASAAWTSGLLLWVAPLLLLRA